MPMPKPGNQHREDGRDLERREVGGVLEQIGKVLQPHPFGGQPKCIGLLKRLQQGLRGWPEEEDGNHRHLRRKQHPWQPGRAKDDAFFRGHNVSVGLLHGAE